MKTIKLPNGTDCNLPDHLVELLSEDELMVLINDIMKTVDEEMANGNTSGSFEFSIDGDENDA